MSSSDQVLHIMEQLSRQNPFSGVSGLVDPLRPDEKNIPSDLPSEERLPFVQQQINLLCYNRLPQTFFNLKKYRPLGSILMTGKETLQEALPIRCLEATFVALYLTQGMEDVVRIPLSFRTQVKRTRYSHIVLVVHLRSPTPRYGTLGLSRKQTLMYRPLIFPSLFDLVLDYKQAYQRLGHQLLDIRLGLAVPHEADFAHAICWRFVALRFEGFDEQAKQAAPKASPTAGGRASYGLGISSLTADASLLANLSGDNVADALGQSLPDADGGASSPSFASMPNLSERSVGSAASSPTNEDAASLMKPTHEDSRGDEALDPAGQTSIEADRANYQSLGIFLSKYSHLLPTMSKQYNKLRYRGAIGVNSKIFFSSLEEFDNPKSENKRRVECIEKLCSPLDLSVLKAVSRLKPSKENGKK